MDDKSREKVETGEEPAADSKVVVLPVGPPRPRRPDEAGNGGEPPDTPPSAA